MEAYEWEKILAETWSVYSILNIEVVRCFKF